MEPAGQDQASDGHEQASFGRDYAAMLQSLADPGRQLADLRTARPQETLAAARDCQRQLERQAARRPDYSDARSTARHLVRLTGGILDEITEHHSVRDVPATAGGYKRSAARNRDDVAWAGTGTM